MKAVERDWTLPAAVLETWREDVPLPSELRRAYTKFAWRRREQRPPRVGRWALALVISGAGFAFAAVGAQRVRAVLLPEPPAEAPAHSAAPSGKTAQRATRTATSRLPPEPAPAAPSAGAPLSPIALDELPLEPVREHNAPARATPSERESPWQRAAKGLRERDLSATEAALSELEARSSPADRETARLIRAQLLLTLGRTTEARWLLEALAAEASSPSVRSKATSLLANSTSRSTPERSERASEATEKP